MRPFTCEPERLIRPRVGSALLIDDVRPDVGHRPGFRVTAESGCRQPRHELLQRIAVPGEGLGAAALSVRFDQVLCDEIHVRLHTPHGVQRR